MESKSIVIHKGGKEEKYKLYVEDYVLSYLKYETGSLEFSEIYFYGIRQEGNRKYVIYGAGRDKQLSVFDTYDLLEEILCRLTQAGPVFMVREPDEVYQIKGFDVFYQDNEAMQRYMVEWKNKTGRLQVVEKPDRQRATAPLPTGNLEKAETKTPRPHGIMSAQLGVILMILVAIVINSANSYDKMVRLNRSAEEVFFAIENQEADDSVSDSYEPGAEIVVERDKDPENERESMKSAEDDDRQDTGRPEGGELEVVNAGNGEESSETGEKETEKEDLPAEEGSLKTVSDTAAGQKDSDGEGTEALSRNVTRYYEVEQGDTLYTICQKIYGDTSQVGKICELNDISNPDRIRSGQKIILP